MGKTYKQLSIVFDVYGSETLFLTAIKEWVRANIKGVRIKGHHCKEMTVREEDNNQHQPIQE